MRTHLKSSVTIILLASVTFLLFAEGGLKDASRRKDLVIGSAANNRKITMALFREVTAKHFNALTVEDELKSERIAGKEGTYNFAPADTIIKFAEDNGLKVRGHTLVWHSQMPRWIESKGWSKEEALAYLKEYITTVVTRYKGRFYAWDVVNEPFDDSGLQMRSADTSYWQRTCGDEYIEQAFRWAHEADPKAKLFLNEYGIELMTSKANYAYAFVKKLLAKKVPIHGIGLQCHLSEETPFSFGSFYQNIKRFMDLGLEVQVTELDIRIPGTATPVKLAHQAEMYGNFFKIAATEKRLTGIITWGTGDWDSWINFKYPTHSSPLLFDKSYNPKPCFDAAVAALKAGPVKLDFSTPTVNRRLIPPFKAMPAGKAPVIDGTMDTGEWDGAVVYPFPFNQLNAWDQNPPAREDLDLNWRILYQGNVVYGLVQRKDDKTGLGAKNSYENDSFEVFFGIDNEFVQLRSVVGKDFEDHYYKGKKKAVWSEDGAILEFSVEMPPKSIGGRIFGWNMAYSDNDSGTGRDCQVYPVNGTNTSWQGEGFGEIEFVGRGKGSRLGRAHPVPSFVCSEAEKIPTVDGTAARGEWDAGAVYPIAYNQISKADLTPPPAADLYASFTIVYTGSTIYGMVRRSDDVTTVDAKTPRENDAVEIYLEVDGKFLPFLTVVGRDFEKVAFKGTAKAVWSAGGDVLEFSIELPNSQLKARILGFNIAVSDNDGKSVRKTRLFPINGSGMSARGQELGELSFR